jgi:PPOX class probable F420-dependent enzyme
MPDQTIFTALATERYVSLTTFRKNGEAVRTPVWMAPDPQRAGVLYVFTGGSAGKVKRIRDNSRVELAPCTMRGKVTGETIPAVARILSPSEVENADRPLTRKYPIAKRLLDFRDRKVKDRRVYLEIR